MAGEPENPFAGYRFHRVVGPRSDAGVYEATEQATDRPVVIETLVGDAAEDEDLRDWFRWAWEEARDLGREGVVAVHDVGEREGVPFAVRESIEGDDLAVLLDRGEPLDPARADAHFDRLAAALSALHEAGVVHGDLEPDSVLIGHPAADEDEVAADEAYLTGLGRVEGHRADDVSGLARIHAAMLGSSYEADGPLAAVHDRAEDGRYRRVDELVKAVAAAREGRAPEEDEDLEDGRAPTSHRRARRGFFVASAIAIAAVVAVVLITSGDGSGTEPAGEPAASAPAEDPPPPPSVSVTGEGGPPDAEPEPDAEPAPTAAATFVSGGPAGLSVRDGVVYVVTSESGELVGFDEDSGAERVGPLELGSGAAEVTVVDGVAWATLQGDDQVARVELEGEGEPSPELIDVGERPAGVIGALGSIFVADSGSGGLSRIDPESGAVTPLIIGAQEPRGIAFGAGSLWVSDAAGFVQKVDPDNPASSESFAAGAEPRGLLVVEDQVWVANSGDGTVSRLDIETGEGEPVDVGGEPLDLATDAEGRIWVANGDGYVSSIEIATESVEEFRIEDSLGAPIGVAVGKEVWVTTEGNTVLPLDTAG